MFAEQRKVVGMGRNRDISPGFLSHLGRSKTGVSRLSSATKWRQMKGKPRDGRELGWLQPASPAILIIKAEGGDQAAVTGH